MRERPQIFRRTEGAINKRLEKIERELQQNSQKMGDMDMDGDMMDDPLLHRLQHERERLYEQRNKLSRILGANPSYIEERDLDEAGGINRGHQARIRAQYPDGEKEELKVTLGSDLDSDFLGNQGVISDSTPLGRAIKGKREGDIVEYQAPGGKGLAKILKVLKSPFIGEEE